MIMRRFVAIAVVLLFVVIASMGFSESDEAREATDNPGVKQSLSKAIATAACDGSCEQDIAATKTDASCAECSTSVKQPLEEACTACCGSCADDAESPKQCFEGACAAENLAETLVGHGPPWARGQNAGHGMQGQGHGHGQGHGMGQVQMGCGIVLREAISHGKIDEQLVQSLVFGPRGSAKHGKQVFVKNCSVCHKLRGQGADIAPDLTNRPRHNPIYLLANLSHPSAVIPNEYQVHVVVTDTGKVVTGLMVNENPKAITILDAANQRTVIHRDEIEDLQLSGKSLMPENLIESLGETQLRDLFQYLRS
jgi:putative heme-binding domain-containing protein